MQEELLREIQIVTSTFLMSIIKSDTNSFYDNSKVGNKFYSVSQKIIFKDF